MVLAVTAAEYTKHQLGQNLRGLPVVEKLAENQDLNTVEPVFSCSKKSKQDGTRSVREQAESRRGERDW